MIMKKIFNIFIIAFCSNAMAGAVSDADFAAIIHTLEESTFSEPQKEILENAVGKIIKENGSKEIDGLKTPTKLKTWEASYEEAPVKPKRELDEEGDSATPPPKSRARIVLGGNSGRLFYTSPAHEEGDIEAPRARDKFVVYVHMLTKGKKPLIKRPDRINFETILGSTAVTEANLDKALLAIENRLRTLIHKNKAIYYRTTYVGLAEKLVHRAHGHVSDVRAFEHEISEIGVKLPKLPKTMVYDDDSVFPLTVNKKVWFTLRAAKALNANVRMSPLVYNIPKKWLPLVEILVGNLFNTTQKAGTILGDSQSYARYRKYSISPIRNKIVYKNEVEQYHNKIFWALLGRDAPELEMYRKCIIKHSKISPKISKELMNSCILDVYKRYK